MNFMLISFITFVVLAFIVPRILTYWRKNYKQPKYSTKKQTPGKFNPFITKVPVVLLAVVILGTLTAIGMDDIEMTIAFGVLLTIFLVLFYFIQRKYDIAYQEKEEYFLLRLWKREYKVHYDDIIDWRPSIHGITVLDESQLEKGYIDVKMAVLKPEILLRKVAEMTFEGKFPRRDDQKPEDPLKKTEMVNFLTIAGYDYLIRDYLKIYREENAGTQREQS